MTQTTKRTPTPARMNASVNTREAMAEAERRMNQPIDPAGLYTITGEAIVQLYAMIDEVPMKYARQLLPAIVGSLEKVEK